MSGITPEIPTLCARELTARGRGAIRVIEVLGDGALDRVRGLISDPARARPPFALVRLVARAGDADAGLLIDEALLVIESPQRLELHLHGSPAVVRRLMSALAAEEWSDPAATLEERAAQALAGSPSEAAARILLDQQEGALRRELERLLRLESALFQRSLAQLVRRGRAARALFHPPRLVLAGPVNAGKSTLFNALVGCERVVVDAAEGTTRDAVRERIVLGAYAVDLIDTAGTRDAPADDEGAAIERAGQRLSTRLQAQADLVLVLVPAGRALSGALPAPGPGRRVLVSRGDEAPGQALAASPSLSALRDPKGAREVVEQVVHEALELSRDPWCPGAAVPFFGALQLELEASLDEPGSERARARIGAYL